MSRKMRHQAQIERQLVGLKFLEQRQDEAALRGGDEVVGVFDAGRDALKAGQRADRVVSEPGAELFGSNDGENGHVYGRVNSEQ